LKKLFPYIIALSALSVSGSAAFYSVYGLSKLFAGASTQVMIMAGSLEVAKLVVASLLYQYWGKINKLLRTYLAIACFVLIVITSGGIYGFLSAAYQATANKSEIVQKELIVIEMKRARFNESRDELKIEKKQIYTSITDLRKSLANSHQVQYIDRESGQLITTTSSSARRALKEELKSAVLELHEVNVNLEAATDSVTQLDIAVLNKESNNEANAELGPLIFISNLTGYTMDRIINWLLLLVIFVFDPLAIALVVAANFAFSLRSTDGDNMTQKEKRKAASVRATHPAGNISPDVDYKLEYTPDNFTFKTIIPEGKEFNTPYPLSDIIKEPNIEESKNIYGDREIKIDLDGDGKADIILKDTDGDGKVDKVIEVKQDPGGKVDGRTGGVCPTPT
jgi:hypothetical protein